MSKKMLYLTDMPADVALNAHEHNYLKLIAACVPLEYRKYGVYISQVEHDDDCAVFRHGNCNCKPDITFIKAATGEVVYAIRWTESGI